MGATDSTSTEPLTDDASKFWESFDPFTNSDGAATSVSKWASVPIGHIYVDPTINTRAIDDALVDEYAEAMREYAAESDDPNHWQLSWRGRPKIVQSGFLFSGFHTVQAAKQVFGAECELQVTVFRGTRHDAFLLATGENYEHGRRRTREEMRESVKRWLLDEEGKTWANRHIAEMCKTSVTTVGRIEQQLSADDSDYDRPLRRRMMREGQEIWIDTEKIGGKSEEELPLIDMADAEEASKLTDLMEHIDRLHADLSNWYAEGGDLSETTTHKALFELRGEYHVMRDQWKNPPIANPPTHLYRLQQLSDRRSTVEELQEITTNIFYHRRVIHEWFTEGHLHKQSPLAMYCTDYGTNASGRVSEHHRLRAFHQLVADQHQLPIELLNDPDHTFLYKRDVEEFRSDEQLLAGTVTSLREKGIAVPDQPTELSPPVRADDDFGVDDTPITPEPQISPPAATANALDDDETPVTPSKPRVPTTQEFKTLDDTRETLNVAFIGLKGRCEHRRLPDAETKQLLADFDIALTRLHSMCADLYTIMDADLPAHRKGGR